MSSSWSDELMNTEGETVSRAHGIVAIMESDLGSKEAN